MVKADYPRKLWREFVWLLKSDWGAPVNLAIVTASVVMATLFSCPSEPSHKTVTIVDGSYHPNWFRIALIVGVALFAVTNGSAIWKEAHRRKYDPTLALKYTDILFKDKETERQTATNALIKFHEGTDKWSQYHNRFAIDPILDVLDHIGFLLQGYQISEWVVYQYFSYWIQLYYEAAEGYIKLRQNEDGSMWEHLPSLYQDMLNITAHKRKKNASELILGERLLDALRAEIPAKDLSSLKSDAVPARDENVRT